MWSLEPRLGAPLCCKIKTQIKKVCLRDSWTFKWTGLRYFTLYFIEPLTILQLLFISASRKAQMSNFRLFHVFFLCHFHFAHTMPCISSKLHVLISPGLTQNRWQVLVYYGSITLQMLYYHAGNAVRLQFHWLVQNCNAPNRTRQSLQIL